MASRFKIIFAHPEILKFVLVSFARALRCQTVLRSLLHPPARTHHQSVPNHGFCQISQKSFENSQPFQVQLASVRRMLFDGNDRHKYLAQIVNGLERVLESPDNLAIAVCFTFIYCRTEIGFAGFSRPIIIFPRFFIFPKVNFCSSLRI